MTPEFASLVNPTLHYVLDLTSRIKGGERVDLKSERHKIRNSLRQAEEQATRLGGRPLADFPLARELLVYWTDELMTVADESWREATLEWEYFNSQDRAWKFYVTGETEARNASGDVVELWYLALVLGFVGDIEDGFARMKRNDFPPVEKDARERWARELNRTVEDAQKLSYLEIVRQLWAKDLERQIPRKQSLGELPKPPLTGDVIPLRGTAFLITTLQWAAALFLLFCLLAFWKLRAGS